MLTKHPNSFLFSCALKVLQDLAFALRSRIAASCASISRAPATALLTITAESLESARVSTHRLHKTALYSTQGLHHRLDSRRTTCGLEHVEPLLLSMCTKFRNRSCRAYLQAAAPDVRSQACLRVWLLRDDAPHQHYIPEVVHDAC